MADDDPTFDEENPELTEADFARAKRWPGGIPFLEWLRNTFPDQAEAGSTQTKPGDKSDG